MFSDLRKNTKLEMFFDRKFELNIFEDDEETLLVSNADDFK